MDPNDIVPCAPPDPRLEPEELRQLVASIAPCAWLELLVTSLRMPAAILNDRRQIVIANEAFAEVSGRSRPGDLVGMRQGEVLACEEASRGPDGCGTGPACVHCGIAHALSGAWGSGGAPVVRECRIVTVQDRIRALDYEATATQAHAGGHTLYVLVLKDISGEKRRRVLERTFFHDVLNTAGCLKGLAELLAEAECPAQTRTEESARLAGLAGRLVDEILFQRQLMAAESGELVVHPQPVVVQSLLHDIHETYAQFAQSLGRIVVVSGSPAVTIVTDRTILLRVLGNLVKNAIEATVQDTMVTVAAAEGPADTVVLSVNNPGVVPQPIQLQLFKRSFSTKARAGRGIGLYSVRLFTEDFLGGRVGFESSAESGTTFTVCLDRKGPQRMGPVRSASTAAKPS